LTPAILSRYTEEADIETVSGFSEVLTLKISLVVSSFPWIDAISKH